MQGKTLDLTLGGGDGSAGAPPRVTSSILDTEGDDTLITIMYTEGIQLSCDVVSQIDIQLNNGTLINPVSFTVSPTNNRLIEIVLPMGIAMGDVLTWSYNPAGACTITGITAPNVPFRPGTFNVALLGLNMPYHVINGTLSVYNGTNVVVNTP